MSFMVGLSAKAGAEVAQMRPLVVRKASLLQLLIGGMTVLVTATGISDYAQYADIAKLLGQEPSFTGFIVGRATSVGMNLLFAFLFFQGMNWGRVLYLALFFVNIVSYIFSIHTLGLSLALGTSHPALAATNVFQIALSLGTCILLTTRSAREWFSAVKKRRQDEKRKSMQ